MCGIAGIVSTADSETTLAAAVRQMIAAEAHRGPDDSGLVQVSSASPVVVFGHRRLAVIDPSPGGHQPMENKLEGDWIIFNGEIYNYRELRQELKLRGHLFHSDCDTEVLLKSYAEWGRSCVLRLRGIFAFAIWDNEKKALFLARDHLGVKPLYYYHAAGRFVFASEVRGVLASGIVPRELSREALAGFLSFGAVQDPQTMVDGVASLLPGHTLFLAAGEVLIERYWFLPETRDREFASQAEAQEEVSLMLREATKSQLVSDAPLGAFLSGGIDSTAIVALMNEVSNATVQTVSVVFDEPEFDERRYSRLAAATLGTRHTELLLTESDVAGHLDDVLQSFDQPSIDGLNTYFVSRVTRASGLTVALSGLGADEVFGGYQGYARALRADSAARVLKPAPKILRRVASKALAASAHTEALRKASDFISGGRAPYFFTRQLFSSHQIGALLGKPFKIGKYDPPTFGRIARETRESDPVNRAAAFELQTYMLSMLLRDTDQMSMAHALEVRVPFLDHKLVELLFTIPGEWKIAPNEPKPLLIRSLGSKLPDECVYRPKMGFALPFEKWLRGALLLRIRDSFLGGYAGPLAKSGLQQIWNDFERGRISWSRIWGIFVVQSWLSQNNVTSSS